MNVEANKMIIKDSMQERNDVILEGGDGVEMPVKAKKARAYWFDWIRATAISLVIFVHTLGVSYDSTGANRTTAGKVGEEKMQGIWKDLVQIGIPMFFYISGFAASFFKTEKRMAYAHFTWGKCTRIIFPFLVAVPLFLIPALWLQRAYASTAISGVTNDSSMFAWFGAYLTQPAEIFNHISWLWYLPAMFVDFMLTYPILRWTKRRQMGISFGRGDIEALVLQLITTIVWIVLNKLVIGDNYSGASFNSILHAIIVLTLCQYAAMGFQLLMPKSDHLALVLRLWGPITCCFINLFKDWNGPSDFVLYDIFLMVDYDAVHFTQGIMDQVYWDQFLRSKAAVMETAFAPFTAGLFLMAYSITQPANSDPGQIWYYPLMKTYTLMCFHTTGTYLWLYATTIYMEANANKVFNARIYNIVCDSALWTYVTHYFFITLIAYWITGPNAFGMNQPWSLFFLFFGTHACCYASYQLFEYLITCGWRKKAERSKSINEESKGLISDDSSPNTTPANDY